MKRRERIITIIMLLVISLSNVAVPVSDAAQMEVSSFPKTAIKSATQNIPAAQPKFHQPDNGSVLGDSTSLLVVGSGTDTQNSASKRVPIRMQQLPQKVYQTNEAVTLAVTNPDDDPFTTSVRNTKGQAIDVPVSESNDGTTTDVKLIGSNEITPGKYTIELTDDQGNVLTQDFSWGVLAMNFDKDTYNPGETGNISFGVLDDQGNMVCDANLQLRVTSSTLGIDDTLSTNATGSASINVNPQCQKHDFSLQPDYQASYTFTKAGSYTMQLTAAMQNGTHAITQTVPVTNNIPFDVQRISATRIYPPNIYPMTINIKANRDFSGTVTETVPQGFTITPATQSAQFTSGTIPTSYDDMQTMYLNSQDPAIQLQHQIATQSAGLVMPFHGNYPITQGFGAQMTDPTLQAFYTQYGLAGHDGVDFGVPMNTPLYAVDDGTIVWSGPGDYGVTIIIQHSWGQSYYGHLSITAVKVGDNVIKGELIGYSGESGEATGPHLHFGIRPNNPDMQNGYYGKVDPLPYLPYNQTPQSIASLGPTVPLVNPSPVLGASTSAEPSEGLEATSSALSVSPSSSATPSATPSVSQTPTATPSGTQSQTTTTITESTTPPANTAISVLDKQILLNEQLANSTQTEKVKVISWQVSLKKGQTTSLGYDFKAPLQSPQFYSLGPLQFYANGSNKVVFQEQRAWEIASDDVGVEWYSNTAGSSWNGYSWQYRKKLDISSSKVSTTPNGTAASLTIGHDADSSSTTSSWSHTTTSLQTNLVMIVGIGSLSNPSGVTYGGNSLTEITHTTNIGTNSLWYMINPPTGANTVSVGGAGTICEAGASTYYNVNQTNPIGNFNGNTGSSTSISVTVSSTNTTQLVVDNLLILHSGPDTVTPGGGQTLTWSGTESSGCEASSPGFGGSYATGGSSSTTMSWTQGSAFSDILDAAALNPASTTVGPTVDFMDSGGDATEDTNSEKGFWGTDIGGSGQTVDCTVSETGPCSLKFTDDAGGAGAYVEASGILGTAGRRVSAYFMFDSSFPQSTHYILYLATSGGATGILSVAITNTGQIQLYQNGSQIGTGATLTTGKWYRIGISYKITSSSNYSATVYVNGVASIIYSQTTSGANNLASTAMSDLYVGLSTPFGAADTIVEHMDDIYVDSGTDVSDPGDVHVTAKLPVTSAADNYSQQGAGSLSGFTACTSGTQCEYVNERPLDINAYLQATTNSNTQEFGIQSASTGDVNIPSNAGIMGDQAWLYLSSNATCSAGSTAIINSGASTNFTLPTSNGMVTNYSSTQTFPSGNTTVGMTSCSAGTARIIKLYEAGVQIAYIPDLINFPVLVNLPSDTDLQTHAQSSGNDILFTDSTGETLLPFELESYNNSNGSLQAWVNISSLSTANDTIIYMYFGNPSAASLANKTATWNGNYVAVYHLGENAASTTINDSTSDAYTGTAARNTTNTATTGQIDGGQSLNGSSDKIDIGDHTNLDFGTGSFSYSMWVNTPNSNPGSNVMFWKGAAGGTEQGYDLEVSSGPLWKFHISDGISGDYTAATNNASNNTWANISYVVNRSNGNLIPYLNGTAGTSASIPGGFGSVSSTHATSIGYDAGSSSFFSQEEVDEMEISNTALSPGWIQTEYNNQNSPSTFEALGNVETDIYAPLLSQMLRHGQFFGSVGVESGVLQPFTW